MRHRLLGYCAAPLALAGLFLGCDSGVGTPVAPVSTIGGLVTGLAQAFCARQVCCGGPAASDDASLPTGGSSDAAVDGGAGTGSSDAGSVCLADGGAASTGTEARSSCQARAAVAINEQLALVATAAAEGLLVINPSAATPCIAAYQNLPCNGTPSAVPSVQNTVSSCAGLFTGYIPVGERCDMTPECVAGSFCLSQGTGQNLISIAGSSSLGICFPYEEVNEACITSGDCDPSTAPVCDTATFTCQEAMP